MAGGKARALRSLLAGGLGLLLLAGGIHAERLPVKSYTTADGLPVDIVIRIRYDKR